MTAWATAGFDVNTFWAITLREADLALRGSLRRAITEQNMTAWGAWHSAAFQRARKMPELKKVMLPDPFEKKRKQTWQEQLAIARMWHDKFSSVKKR